WLEKLEGSTFIALISACAAFGIICDSLVAPLPYSGVWYSWIFISEPITGILLGPWAGFLANLIGVMIGHLINYIDAYEFLFTLGAPLGAMISALAFRRRWGIILTYYLALLGGFFAAPVSWQLPFWGMWDVYLAFANLLFLAVITSKWKNLWNTKSKKRLIYILALSVFIGLEADVLFRIFIFVPCQTYNLFYGYSVEGLQAIWALGAVETPIKVALSAIIASIAGPPIIDAIRKLKLPV
ncbi:MAG: hypothetical protein QXJ31_05970, partial [Candidatus Bathyarchaeia archaeon]